MDVDKKIQRWKGGRLRVFGVNRTMRRTGKKNDRGEALYTPALAKPKFLGEIDAVPFGDGLAIAAGESYSDDFERELRLWFGFRRGNLECIRIEPLPDGPPLTQARLRIPIDKLVSEYALHSTYRLEVDDQGEVVGVMLTSPLDPWDTRSWDEIARDELPETVRRPGRPRTSDAELRRVAAVVREAESARQPIVEAVETKFVITTDAAKKRIKKARERGFLPPTQRGASDG